MEMSFYIAPIHSLKTCELNGPGINVNVKIHSSTKKTKIPGLSLSVLTQISHRSLKPLDMTISLPGLETAEVMLFNMSPKGPLSKEVTEQSWYQGLTTHTEKGLKYSPF